MGTQGPLHHLPSELLRYLVLHSIGPPGPLSLSQACRSFRDTLNDAEIASAWLSQWHDVHSLGKVLQTRPHRNTLNILRLLSEEHDVILAPGGDPKLGRTTLHTAVAHGHTVEVVDWLLHAAKAAASRAEVAAAMAKTKVAPDAMGRGGSAPGWAAAPPLGNGDIPAAGEPMGATQPPSRSCLEVWLNKRDRGGPTALGLACILGRTDLVRALLLQPGIDVNIATGVGNGKKALHG